MQKQIWWYGTVQPPEGTGCTLLREVEKVHANDIILIEEMGIMAANYLIGQLPEKITVVIVCYSLNREKMLQWQSYGYQVVTWQSVLPFLAELQEGTQQDSIPTGTTSPPIRQAIPVLQKQSPALRPIQEPRLQQQPANRQQYQQVMQKPQRSGGFFLFGKKSRKQQRHMQNGMALPMSQYTAQAYGKIIAVISPRGQVGKTSFIANAASMCARSGMSVLVCECDPHGTLKDKLEYRPNVTLADLLAHNSFTNIEDYICSVNDHGFQSIFAGPDGALLDENAVTWLKNELVRVRQQYSVIFFDMAPEHNTINTILLQIADEVLFFVQPEVDVLDRAWERYQLLIADENHGYGLHVDKVKLVFSRIIKGAHSNEDMYQFAGHFPHGFLGVLSEVPAMRKFTMYGELLTEEKPGHKYTKEIEAILSALISYQPKKMRRAF